MIARRKHKILSFLTISVITFSWGQTLCVELIQTGEWSGTIVIPHVDSSMRQEVAYSVERDAENNLSITMHTVARSYLFTNIKIKSGKLTFVWSPGDKEVSIKCFLEKEEDTRIFVGKCPIEGQSEHITIKMIPPTSNDNESTGE